LDRVGIAPSTSDADTVTGERSPTLTSARHTPVIPTGKALTEKPKEADEDVSAEVADAVAAGEEAVPEEEDQKEAEEKSAEPPIPSPITRDMYVRLVQEYSEKDKVPDQDFQDSLNRINFYQRCVADRLFLKRARNQVDQDHMFSEDVKAEILARIYFSGAGNSSCDICKEECPDVFHHCVICNNNGLDVCQACLDKGTNSLVITL